MCIVEYYLRRIASVSNAVAGEDGHWSRPLSGHSLPSKNWLPAYERFINKSERRWWRNRLAHAIKCLLVIVHSELDSLLGAWNW